MKTAIIGMGRMGLRHLQAVQQLDLEIVGICDQRSDALQEARQEYNIPTAHHFTDAQELLDKAQPELVIIATTAPSHAPLTCMAADAGASHILCEKPMAVSLAECDRMIETCQKNQSLLAINHGRRFLPHGQEANQIIHSPAFGDLSSMTLIGTNMGIAMNGVHFFELFHYLCQEESQTVTAWFSPGELTNPRGVHFKDRAGAVRLETSSGKRFYMDISINQGYGTKIIYTGEYGQLVIDENSGYLHSSVREEQYRDRPTNRYVVPGLDTNKTLPPLDVVGASKSVTQALLDGSGFPTGTEGKATISALVSAYLSNEENHRSVNLAEENLPDDRIFPWA